MRLLFLILLASCSGMEPKEESDLRFCHSDEQCSLYQSSCGKVVAFNIKFFDFVKKEFDKRDKKAMCHQSGPDSQRYRAVCEQNTCSLISF